MENDYLFILLETYVYEEIVTALGRRANHLYMHAKKEGSQAQVHSMHSSTTSQII